MEKKEKPKYGMCSNIGYMLGMAWKYQKRVLVLLVLVIAVNVSLNLTELLAAPAVLQKVETAASLGTLLSTIGIFTLLLVCLKFLDAFCDGWTKDIAQTYVRTRIVHDINHKSVTTAYPNTRDTKAEKLLGGAQRATDSSQAAAQNFWNTFSSFLSAVGGLILYVVLLQNLNPFLLLVAIATTTASYFAHRHADNWYYEHREYIHKFYFQMAHLERKATGIELAKDIRIFGLQGWLTELYNGLLHSWSIWSKEKEKTGFYADLVNVLLVFLRNGIAYAFLLYQTVTENLSASEFLLYFTAISGFTTWITILLGRLETLHRESMEISTIREYINYPEPFRFVGGKPVPKADQYEIRLEDVTFRYPGSEKNLFEHLNLTIHPGEKLAVVGLNGAGKTSLVLLICGFYDPNDGRILLNGQDIREFNRREYYGLLSAVYQQYSITDVTVGQNVASSADQVDEQKVWDCLQKAGLDQFVKGLPKQLDTPVGRDVYLDGVLFSGGQTQRLMLARALYKDGGILVLDEPTAALDPIAENDIYQKYNEMTTGKTSLFISHRLASTRFCDRIIFLDHGQIVEEGTHESLLQLGGAYAKLFAVQARYYQEGREFR